MTTAENLRRIHANLESAARHGVQIDHPFSYFHPDPVAHRQKFILPAKSAKEVNAVDLNGTLPSPTCKVDEYLHRMLDMTSVVSKERGKGDAGGPFADTSILLLHHLTAEVLGTIAALRALGCRDLVTVFVGYNEDAESAYRPDLDDLPEEEFRCFILKSTTASGGGAEGTYSIARSFTKAPEKAPLHYDAIDQAMREDRMDFLQAMRCLGVSAVLQQMARASAAGRKCLVIEDGGYLAPILNDAALSGQSVTEFRSSHRAPDDQAVDNVLGDSLQAALEAHHIGAVEHTRNGYDRDMRVNLNHGKLARPVFSIAVSYTKTQVESDIVGSSIINAATSVLYSHGYVLKRRNVLVFGSRGNIGRRMMRHFVDHLADAETNLIGCDLKVGSGESGEGRPDWQTDPGTSSVPGCIEKRTYAEFDRDRTRDLDLIIGMTGGPTPGHPVLQVQDIQDWLVHGKKRDLYLASGSSKTDEYPEILSWMDEILGQREGATTLDGRKATVAKSEIKDAVSGRNFGSIYTFSIELEDRKWHTKNLLFLNNLMPVNFLFYGVPTEVIDEVLSQIVSAAVALRRRAEEVSEARLYAVDYDRIASEGVFGSKTPDQDLPRPLPADS